MVVKHIREYMNDHLIDRVQTLQKALNQAEYIIQVLDNENQRLKDVLANLASENNQGYTLNTEILNESVCSI